ncbi:reverse transcriptase-like protein, partial [mine drainage metagenome]
MHLSEGEVGEDASLLGALRARDEEANPRGSVPDCQEERWAPGIDGQSFEAIEASGLAGFLEEIRDDLESGRYQPKPNRRVDIPKENGKVRTL